MTRLALHPLSCVVFILIIALGVRTYENKRVLEISIRYEVVSGLKVPFTHYVTPDGFRNDSVAISAREPPVVFLAGFITHKFCGTCKLEVWRNLEIL